MSYQRGKRVEPLTLSRVFLLLIRHGILHEITAACRPRTGEDMKVQGESLPYARKNPTGTEIRHRKCHIRTFRLCEEFIL